MTSGGAAASCPDTGNCVATATPTTTPSTPSHVTMRRLMCSPPPTTNHQPPTTNHQPPTTNHRSPLLIALSRCALASTCRSAAAAATGTAPTSASLRLLHRPPFALDALGE